MAISSTGVEPDREHVLADASLKLTADLPPDAQILGARDVEASTDLVEVDADRSSPAPPSIADVALLDDRPALGAPPFRGVGGVPDSGVQGFPSRARVGWRGFWRGFGGVYAGNPAHVRTLCGDTPLRTGPFRPNPAQARTLSIRNPAQVRTLFSARGCSGDARLGRDGGRRLRSHGGEERWLAGRRRSSPPGPNRRRC